MTDKTNLSTEISDWRLADNAGDELTGAQALPWAIKSTEGAYGGVIIQAVDPTGKIHQISIEIDKGNLTALFFRSVDDDPDLKVTVCETSTIVEPTRHNPGDTVAIIQVTDESTHTYRGQIPERLA